MIAYLKHRRATEDETRFFYRRMDEIEKEVASFQGRDRIDERLRLRAEMQFYYKPELESVMWRPTEEQEAAYIAQQIGITANQFDSFLLGWRCALGKELDEHQMYDNDTIKAIEKGVSRRRYMTPSQRLREAAEHRARYV